VTRRFRAALCGYYGFGNLGDELLAAALVSAFEKTGIPVEEVAILSSDPERTFRETGIRAAARWNPAEVFSLLRESETLLLGGGGLFQDSTSVRSCAYYWGVVRLAKAAGAVPWCCAQSVGPFRSAAGSLLARNALGQCVSRTVRDERSRDLLASWGLESEVVPDPVFALQGEETKTTSQGKRLLVNVRPWKDDLSDRTAAAASRLAAAAGLPLTAVALAREDLGLMEDQAARGIFAPEEIVFLEPENWRERTADIFENSAGAISMRYHFALLCLISGIPLSLSAYDPKVEAFGEEWGVPCWNGEGDMAFPAASAEEDRVRLRSARFLEKFRRTWNEVRSFVHRKGRSLS